MCASTRFEYTCRFGVPLHKRNYHMYTSQPIWLELAQTWSDIWNS